MGGAWPGNKDKPNGTKFDPSFAIDRRATDVGATLAVALNDVVQRAGVSPAPTITTYVGAGLWDALKETQQLLKHRNPDGDLSELVERGLDLLIAEVRGRRFGVGGKRKGTKKASSQVVGAPIHPLLRGQEEGIQVALEDPCEKSDVSNEPALAKPSDERLTPPAGKEDPCQSALRGPDEHQMSDNEAQLNRKARSRYIPAEIRRAVVQRDGERCSFVDDRGNRCSDRGGLEFDHIEGFARTGEHSVQGIRLMCRAHNQWAAENMYGRSFIKGKRLGLRDYRSASVLR